MAAAPVGGLAPAAGCGWRTVPGGELELFPLGPPHAPAGPGLPGPVRLRLPAASASAAASAGGRWAVELVPGECRALPRSPAPFLP